MAFNLTAKRLRALRMIQQRPGLLACALVDLCETRSVAGREFNGFMRSRTGAQGATRWGAQYAKPLIAAGLVTHRFSDVGWAKLWLTPLGEHVARTGALSGSRQTSGILDRRTS